MPMGLGTTPSLLIFSKVKPPVVISGVTGLVGGVDSPAHHPGKEAAPQNRMKGLLCVTRTTLAAGCRVEVLDPCKAFFFLTISLLIMRNIVLLSRIPSWA